MGQLCQLRNASKIHVLQIKRYAGGLHDQADKLLQHAEKMIKHAKGPLYPADKQAAESDNGSGEETSTCGSASSPEHGNSVVRQESGLDGYYNGGIKLESAQLGKHTVRNIYRIVEEFPASKEIGYFKSTAGNDLSIDLEKISGSTIRIESWYQSQAVRLSPSENYELRGLMCKHEVAPVQSSSFRIPDLHWTDPGLDYRELLSSTVRDAYGEDMSYLVMPVEFVTYWLESIGLSSGLLDCGRRLKLTNGWIHGVHTAYLYISASRGSGSALHVEDGFLGSINVVLAGAPKVWLMVEPEYREELESKAKERLGGKDYSCSQFVRHLDSLLSPELLDQWEIPYRIVPCGAGEMIATFAETYHQVVNVGPNISMAINFAPDPHWAGPPKNYQFCGRCGGKHRVRKEQLQIQQPGHRLEGAIIKETEADSNRSPDDSNPSEIDMDLPDEQVDEAVSEMIRMNLPSNWNSSMEPPTPGNPCGYDGPSPEEPFARRAPDEQPHDAATPMQAPETPEEPRWPSSPSTSTPKLPSKSQTSPCGTTASSSILSTPPESLSTLHESPREVSTPPTSPNNPPETSNESRHSPCELSTPPTVLTELCVTSSTPRDPKSPTKLIEPEIQRRESDQRRAADAQSDKRAQPIIILSPDHSRVDDSIEVLVDHLGPRPTYNETLEAKFDRLIKHVNGFIKPLQVSEATIERFRPSQKLDDDGILLVLGKILPKSSEALIATFAIQNPPKSLCHRYTESDVSSSMPPLLRHNTESTHLFIACNVNSTSLESIWGGSCNHWILVVVDLHKNQKVYVFGNEGGHGAEAEVLAYNIGLFVNNYRRSEGVDPISWSNPEIYPVRCDIPEYFVLAKSYLVVSNRQDSRQL